MRQLAIEKVSARTQKPSSYIRLRGQWLCALGFPPGKRVYVVPLRFGVIALRVLKNGSLE